MYSHIFQRDTTIRDPTILSLVEEMQKKEKTTDRQIESSSAESGERINNMTSRFYYNKGTNHSEYLVIPKTRRKPGRPSRGKSSPTPVSKGSWGSILVLDHLELDPGLLQRVRPALLGLQQDYIGTLRPSRTIAMPEIDPRTLGSQAKLAAVIAYAQTSEHTSNLQALNYLFSILLVGDMRFALFGDRSIDAVTAEIGQILTISNEATIFPTGSSMTAQPAVENSSLKDNLKRGENLRFLCRSMEGPGCLFYLHSVLTPNL